MLVVPSQGCVEVVYPFVGELNGMLDAFQTKSTHEGVLRIHTKD